MRCLCLQGALQDLEGSSRQSCSSIDSFGAVCASEPTQQAFKRRRLVHLQQLQHQAESDRSSQLGMPIWRDAHNASLFQDDGQWPQHSLGAQSLPAPQTNSQLASDLHPSEGRSHQEHRHGIAAVRPVASLMQPGQYHGMHEKAPIVQASEGNPCRADLSWIAALLAANLPSQRRLNAAWRTEQHATELTKSNADGSASQRSLPAQQADASHSNAASSDQQYDDVGPVVPAQPPQQSKARFVAVHGNYHHYYGTRTIADFQDDSRLKVVSQIQSQIVIHPADGSAEGDTCTGNAMMWQFCQVIIMPKND